MRIEGDRKLIRQLERLTDTGRAEIRKAVQKSVEEGERVARTLAPDASGKTRGAITHKISRVGMMGQVIAVQSNAPQDEKDRAYSVEHGRTRGDRGTTAGNHHMWRTRQYLAKRWKGRLRRAIKSAVREAVK